MMTAERMPLGYLTHTVTARDGIALSCREYGSTAADHTVILLHGFCLAQSTWALQIGALLDHFGASIRIITFDYRGHGTSGPAPMHACTIGHLAQDLADVATALRVTGAVTVAGHSMGAMALLTYLTLPAPSRPITPTGLVLAASAAGHLTQRGIGRLLATPGLGALSALVEHLPHQAAEDTMRALARPVCQTLARLAGLGPEERSTITGATADALARTTIASTIGFLASLRSFDATAALATIAAPTTIVISGGKDLITPAAHAEELAAGIPGAIHIHEPAAGHMVLYDAAATVTAAISATIDRSAVPAARTAR
jgi:pimeloyl-ACP methyl ester carboxylesterase